MKKNYEINNKTVALYGMKNKTRVYEKDKNFVIEKSPYEIMEESCNYYGSSFKGRKIGTKNLIGIEYKPPIVVEDANDLIFFPTESPRLDTCSWIRLSEVDKYYRFRNNVIIEFKNGDSIMLKNSYNIIDNQVLKAARLESVLRHRKSSENAEKKL